MDNISDFLGRVVRAPNSGGAPGTGTKAADAA